MTIRDQSYTRYDGPTRHTHLWATIGWNGVRTAWSFWRTKLTLLAIWLVPVTFVFVVIAEAALAGDVLSSEAGISLDVGVARFLQIQFFAVGILFIARGCNLVADDMRHKTVQLYFSKPISRFDYAAGKVITLMFMALVGVIVPSALVAAMRTAFYIQTDIATDLAIIHLQALVLLTLVSLMATSLVLGISSLTDRAGYAVLIWLGVLLVPMIIPLLVTVTTDGSEWASMLSLTGIIGLASDAWLGSDSGDVPRWLPFVAIFALIGAGLGALHHRLSRLEGIT